MDEADRREILEKSAKWRWYKSPTIMVILPIIISLQVGWYALQKSKYMEGQQRYYQRSALLTPNDDKQI